MPKKLTILNEVIQSNLKQEKSSPKKAKSPKVSSDPILTSVTSDAKLTFDPTAKEEPINTRANSNHSYYQYIHPCTVTKDKIEYAYYIVREGKNITSKPYSDIKKCHEDLLHVLEGLT